MNAKVFLFVCFGYLVLVLPTAWSSNVVRKVDRWYWYPEEINVAAMSEAERNAVVAEMRRRLPDSDSTDRKHYRWILIRYFGDEETIGEVMADIRSDDPRRVREGMSVVSSASNPSLIPQIAEFLYYPEGMEVRTKPGSDVVWDTRPRWAAVAIRRIVWMGNEFSPEVKEWVKGIKAYEDIRRLWEENREAFMRKEYAGVRPPKGERVSELPAANPPVATSAVSVAPPVVSVVTQTVATVPAEMSSGVDGTLVLVVGVLVLLGAAIVLFWRVYRK